MSVTSTALPSTLRSRRRARSGGATLAVASITQFMVVLDVTIINVALPQMRAALHMSTAGQQWVVNAYALTFAGFLMLGGRAADLFGRKRVFLLGLAGFTLFSFLGGLAQSSGELIAARGAQGIGGAVLAPASLSLLTATFTEPHERRRALGVWSATAASGAPGGADRRGTADQHDRLALGSVRERSRRDRRVPGRLSLAQGVDRAG
jgi:MFS family permease